MKKFPRVQARAMGAGEFSRDAVTSPSPRSGQVKRTALPDDFDGIRFEIGRMAQFVKDSVHDPAVHREAAEITGSRNLLMGGPELSGPERRLVKLEAVDRWCREHARYVNDPPNIEVVQTPGRMMKQTRVPREVIQYLMTPFYDAFQRAEPPVDVESYVPHRTYIGDCVPYSQKVIVQDERGAYRILPIGDLERSWNSCSVVSWNESLGKAEPRRISAFIDKGVLPVYRVQLSNGVSFRCTKNHQLYVLVRPHRSQEWALTTMTLEELISRRSKSESLREASKERFMIPVSAQIPESPSGLHDDLSDEQLWVEGLNVAEGWRERSSESHNWRARIGMNNPEAIAKLKECLELMNVPYGESTRKGDGLVTVGLRVSKFTTHLAEEFGRNSEYRQFPDSYLSLGRDQMETALEGFAIGDGYYPGTGRWARVAHLIYNTQSEILARQISFMHLVLGRPLSFYRQPAWKRKPVMYRLYEYKGERRRILNGLAGSRIVSIEADEPERCCDITVEGNHNFLLEGGVLVHNCDELVTASTALNVAAFSRDLSMGAGDEDGGEARFFFQFGGNEGTLHHVWSKTLLDGTEYHADHTEEGFKLGDHSRFEAYEDLEVNV